MSVPTDDLELVWKHHCRLTCEVGSEDGVCPCPGPSQCEMQGHPSFEAQRTVAVLRIFAHVPDEEKLE